MTATTIREAIAGLHDIVDAAATEGSRLGYFAALYARVTAAIAGRIREGCFDDDAWMERLDVLFASRYLEELRKFRAQEQGVTESWRITFEACADPRPTVLQHLYLGMNAHLLVDLPLALAEACDGPVPQGRRKDFLRINEIVGDLMEGFHEDLGRASPRLGKVQRRAGAVWGAASRVTLTIARELAWRSGCQLARRPTHAWPDMVARLDARAAWLGRRLLSPGRLGRRAFAAIRMAEAEDVRAIIQVLRMQ